MSSVAVLRVLLLLLLFAVLSFVNINPARGQTPEVGAQVFLAQPGLPISTTLLAAPSTSDFWFTQIWFPVPVATGGATQPFSSNSTIGSTVVSPPVPFQGG